MTPDETLDERLANRRKPGDPDYDAFYDATDDELAVMVPPSPPSDEYRAVRQQLKNRTEKEETTP